MSFPNRISRYSFTHKISFLPLFHIFPWYQYYSLSVVIFKELRKGLIQFHSLQIWPLSIFNLTKTCPIRQSRNCACRQSTLLLFAIAVCLLFPFYSSFWNSLFFITLNFTFIFTLKHLLWFLFNYNLHLLWIIYVSYKILILGIGS